MKLKFNGFGLRVAFLLKGGFTARRYILSIPSPAGTIGQY